MGVMTNAASGIATESATASAAYQPEDLWSPVEVSFMLGENVWGVAAGVFTSGIYDWQNADASGTVTNVSNTLQMEAGAGIGGVTYGRVGSIPLHTISASLLEAVIAGQRYSLLFDGKANADQDIYMYITDLLGGGTTSYPFPFSANSWVSAGLTFTGSSFNMDFSSVGFDGAGEQFWIDNIFLKKQSRGLGSGSWAATGNNIVFVCDGGVCIHHVDSTSGAGLSLDASGACKEALVPGQEYTVSFVGKVSGGAAVDVDILQTAAITHKTISSTSFEKIEFTFRRDSYATIQILVKVSAGETTTINNFSIRPA